MTAWLAFIIGGFATYALRASFIVLLGERTLPEGFGRALRYVGPAVFAAMVLPAVVGDEGVARLVRPDPRLLALMVGAAVMWCWRNMTVTLLTGMGTLWFLQWLWP